MSNENKKLQNMILVSAIGDFVGLFASLLLLQQIFNSTTISAYVVPVKSIAIAAAGLLIPRVLSGFKTRAILFWSQILSFLSILLLLAYLSFAKSPSPWFFYLQVFANTVLWQFFVASREAISKSLSSTNSENRTFTAQLLSGLMMAQTLGPIFAIGLIFIAGPKFALAIDALSFLVCAVLSAKVSTNITYQNKISLKNAMSYVFQSPMIRKIFVLRTIGYWPAMSIFNLVLFDFATKGFPDFFGKDNSILGSAVFYSLCGFGGFIGNYFIHKNVLKLGNYSNGKLAMFGMLFIAFVFLGFQLPINPAFLCVVYFLQAVGNGSVALATQTIRRNVTTQTEFAEILSLEVIFGRAVDWTGATLASLLLIGGYMTPTQLMLIASGWYLLVAPLHKKFE